MEPNLVHRQRIPNTEALLRAKSPALITGRTRRQSGICGWRASDGNREIEGPKEESRLTACRCPRPKPLSASLTAAWRRTCVVAPLDLTPFQNTSCSQCVQVVAFYTGIKTQPTDYRLTVTDTNIKTLFSAVSICWGTSSRTFCRRFKQQLNNVAAGSRKRLRETQNARDHTPANQRQTTTHV